MEIQGMTSDIEQINLWLQQGFNLEYISSRLEREGKNPLYIQDLLAEFSRIRNSKRLQNGNLLMSIGVILMVLGFGASLMLYYIGEPFGWMLYGVTGAGILLLFAGMYLVFQ